MLLTRCSRWLPRTSKTVVCFEDMLHTTGLEGSGHGFEAYGLGLGGFREACR